MKLIITLSLATLIYAEQTPQNINQTKQIKQMFPKGKISAKVDLLYSANHIKNSPNQYATAIGSNIFYELAEYNGFSGGLEFSSAHNINKFTGDGKKENQTLSSSDGSYTQLTQGYINYTHKGLNIRLGSQQIDTPLADSDHIRLIDNRFQALMATYELNDFVLTVGYLDKWQGTDTGLNNSWQNTGDNGAYFSGIFYSNGLIDYNIWYYDISKDTLAESATGNIANKSIYADLTLRTKLSDNLMLNSSVQYLKQNEQSNSDIKANIYGLMSELVFKKDLTFYLAYNESKKQNGKHSFSGFGGGTLYTNMDIMIIDDITDSANAKAITASVLYDFKGFNLLYAYGRFDTIANNNTEKIDIVEQNIGLEYNLDENIAFSAVCVIRKNEKSTVDGENFNNYRLMTSYSF
jgi:hypothetical protein